MLRESEKENKCRERERENLKVQLSIGEKRMY